ncbi:MAG: ABC transporter permease [Verrucomicrobia bacterium]|nr:ABC transporter permease [Verrucomicrobiota bacterium]MBS0637917.1 ABC transporter permease [Verrucomicrobiota bacterium]
MQNRQGAAASLKKVAAIIQADLCKLRHDPIELFMRMIQPAMWLLLFGTAMNHINPIHVQSGSYLDFIAPGVLAQSVLFVAIFYGIALIWERDSGILYKLLVTPAPRSCLVIGRALGAGIRSLCQMTMIYLLSLLLGIHLNLDPVSIGCVALMVMIVAAIFSTFSLIVASIVKKRERFMGIGQLLTMPFFFASNALYPIDSMPAWIHTLSRVNPLTYQVDALRALMIQGETAHFGLAFDFGVSLLIFLVLASIATKLYPRILY